MIINIDPLCGIFIEEVAENGTMRKKHVNFEDIQEIFQKNITINTGILPKDCVFFEQSDGKTVVILQKDPQIYNIKYHKRGDSEVNTFKIPMPYCFFGLVIADKKIQKSLLVCSKMPLLKMDCEIFQFPLGNVFTDTGEWKICWGRTAMPNIPSPRFAAGIPNLFFSSPFNEDLTGNTFVGYSEGYDMNAFLEDLNGAEFFPIEKLKPLGTFRDLLLKLRIE